VRLHTVGNALQFLSVLEVNVRPKRFARRLAEKFPVTPRLPRVKKFNGFEPVGNLRRQQIPVLEADFPRCAFQVNISPASILEAIGLGQNRVERRRRRFR
jgi:hypothetical protein